MFGLMNPGRQDVTFRRAYARCCQHQRKHHGLPSLGFLSYESVLLYLFALDAGKLSDSDLPAQTCCRLRRLTPAVSTDEREVARFCNSLGLLLAYIKVADDLRDRGTLGARFLSWLMRHRFDACFAYFRRLDPAFPDRVRQFVDDHLALEHPDRPMPLEEYVVPTARAFGYVFGLMSRLAGLEGRREQLERLGEHLGAAIIAFDCAADYERDRRRGEYNPLPDGERSVAAARAYCLDRLTQAATECRHQFGADSRLAHSLTMVRQRLLGLCQPTACARASSDSRQRLERWGIGKKRGTVQLNQGWEIWAALVGVAFILLTVLNWIGLHLKSKKKEREEAEAREANAAPVEDSEAENASAAVAPVLAQQATSKKSGAEYCCFVDCSGCVPDCAGDIACGDCFGLDGCGDACSGCDGCDCSCG